MATAVRSSSSSSSIRSKGSFTKTATDFTLRPYPLAPLSPDFNPWPLFRRHRVCTYYKYSLPQPLAAVATGSRIFYFFFRIKIQRHLASHRFPADNVTFSSERLYVASSAVKLGREFSARFEDVVLKFENSTSARLKCTSRKFRIK